MARRNRRKHQQHENHERWLITYADLITLLLIFFVVMYAMSKIDAKKYDVLSQALKSEFLKADSIMQQGEGVMGAANPAKGGSDETKREQQEKEHEEKQLENLLEQIQAYIDEHQLQTQISAADTPRGVAITLNDLFLFDLGNAELKPAAFPILNQLASLFPCWMRPLVSKDIRTICRWRPVRSFGIIGDYPKPVHYRFCAISSIMQNLTKKSLFRPRMRIPGRWRITTRRRTAPKTVA